MSTTVARIAETLDLNETELLNKSLHEFLERKLAYLQAEIFKMKLKYNIESAKEMEDLFKRGEIDEEDSWEDFFKFDHLEYKLRELQEALKEL